MKMLQNKLNQFREWSKDRLLKFKATLKIKKDIYQHRFTDQKHKIKTKITGKYKSTVLSIDKSLFKNYYGTRLLRTRTVVAGYLITITALYSALYLVSGNALSNFRYINFTEQSISILIVFLTVLLSAGFVFLGDDTRGWALARITIINDIVKLKGLVVAIGLICIVSITPDYQIADYTLKELLSPIIFCCFLFIIGIYIRIYLWLSDLAADPGLFEDKDPKDSRPFISSSYRFARIVNQIEENNARDVWQSILEKRIPFGYEELIHELYFESIEKILKNKKRSLYGDILIRLEIYDKYYERRNLDSWRFYLDYTKRFIVINSLVSNAIDKDRASNGTEYLYRAKRSSENVIKRLIDSSLNRERAWHLFEAMDTHVTDTGLLKIGKNTRVRNSVLLNYFLDSFFESVLNDELDTYDIESYISEHKHWRVTYDNLYKDRYNVSFVVANQFKEWLFKKLENLNEKDDLYGADSIIETIFSEADPLTMADLYWLLFQSKGTDDSEIILSKHYQNPRPFGIAGRSTGFWADEEEVRMKNFVKFQNEQEENAIQLFATIYATWFRQVWNLDELLKIGAKKLSSNELDDREKQRLESLLRRLDLIQKFYKSEQQKAKKK